jgi:acyl-CoA synthetase (AMP-forming)/AMP-acid ligase II
MSYVHSIQRAVRYYPENPALCAGDVRLNFKELHDRVRNLAGALSRTGFKSGDRLAVLLPNGPEYIQLVYACSWLGVTVVPINTRLSVVEIDHILEDARPLRIDPAFFFAGTHCSHAIESEPSFRPSRSRTHRLPGVGSSDPK